MPQHLICSTGIGNPVTSEERPAYLLHRQLKQQIIRDLGASYANFFAEPVFDNRDNVIDWFTEIEGGIQRFAELNEDARIEYVGQVERLLNKLKKLAVSYLESEDTGKVAIGQALQDASKPPADEYRYLVGDQPVIVYWGFRQAAEDYEGYLKKYIEIIQPPAQEAQSDSEAQEENATDQIESTTEQQKSTTEQIESTTEQIENTASVSQEADSEQTQEPPDDQSDSAPLVADTREQSWFDLLLFAGRILWGTVALFLIIAFILFILWLADVWPPATDYKIPSSSGDSSLSLLDEIRSETDKGEILRAELDALNRDLLTEKCNCKPDTVPVPESSLLPEPDSRIDEVIKQCEIRHLKGVWHSKSNEIFDVQTGVPLIYQYSFDGEGRGKVTINNSAKGVVCEGSAQADFNEQCTLLIKSSNAGCPGESTYYESTEVTCAFDAEKRVTCTVEQPSYDTFEAQFIWQGSQ